MARSRWRWPANARTICAEVRYSWIGDALGYSVAISADRWPDHLRLSDIPQRCRRDAARFARRSDHNHDCFTACNKPVIPSLLG